MQSAHRNSTAALTACPRTSNLLLFPKGRHFLNFTSASDREMPFRPTWCALCEGYLFNPSETTWERREISRRRDKIIIFLANNRNTVKIKNNLIANRKPSKAAGIEETWLIFFSLSELTQQSFASAITLKYRSVENPWGEDGNSPTAIVQ